MSPTSPQRPYLPLIGALLLSSACQSKAAPEPEPAAKTRSEKKKASDSSPTQGGGTAPGEAAKAEDEQAKRRARLDAIRAAREKRGKPGKVSAKPVARVKASKGDPLEGKFTMEDALAGLDSQGDRLMADIHTDAGKLECELWPEKAPITVANFVGLARGTRPWKRGSEWVKEPLYAGTTFHRVIKGFMIQGGDPNGNGSGGPGYVIPDEIWEDAHHDERGLICMANRGPNTNGSQFFIMDGKATRLDGEYTIFGKCGPDAVIEKLAGTAVRGDRATSAPKITRVDVRRADAG